jgi:hypothetical protein
VESGIDGSSEVRDEHSVKVKNKSLYNKTAGDRRTGVLDVTHSGVWY